jgi:hypothetical protein
LVPPPSLAGACGGDFGNQTDRHLSCHPPKTQPHAEKSPAH